MTEKGSELGPTGPTEREPILDVLRGFALLGILLVNIELMRGPALFRAVGGPPEEPASVDQALQFFLGWLVAGKFMSSFAIMFGIGAAFIVARAVRAGRFPRRLLARRYAVLIALGSAHIILLFPGDILLAYGVTGMVLLPFTGVKARTALGCATGILLGGLVIVTGLMSLAGAGQVAPSDAPGTAEMMAFFSRRIEEAIAAHQHGHFGAIVTAHLWEAAFVQAATLAFLPWILALFLIGLWAGRSGFVHDLRANRGRLRIIMVVGLVVGLPLNLAMGFLGPLAMGPGLPGDGPGGALLLLAVVGQIIGAPLLALGYLSALALLCLRVGPIRPLAAVGRMALSAYLLQSLLGLVVFAGLGLYDRLTVAQAMLVVVGIWAILLAVCPLWMRFFRFGPVEWLWRTLTYGRRQPLRAR